jgi:Rod binding domain-containing protein
MALSSLTPTIDPSVARMLTGTNIVTKSMSVADKNEAKIRQAAEGFERVLIRQMLSSARKVDLSGQDNTSLPSSGYLQLMDDHWADLLAKVGSLGFGKKMADELLNQQNIKQLINPEQKAVNVINDKVNAAKKNNEAHKLYDANNLPSFRRFSN